MVLRVPVFAYVMPSALWKLVESDARTARLSSMRDTWKGALIGQGWFVFGVICSLLTAAVPWPMRVSVCRHNGSSPEMLVRIRWLGWLFLWGVAEHN